MSNEEITALAREYAEECTNPSGFSKATYEEMVEERAENASYVLRWLCDRFCLVEKSKVAEEYKRAIETNRKGKETGVYSLCTMGSARKVLLESIFPEIGKEVKG